MSSGTLSLDPSRGIELVSGAYVPASLNSAAILRYGPFAAAIQCFAAGIAIVLCLHCLLARPHASEYNDMDSLLTRGARRMWLFLGVISTLAM